MYIYNNWYVLCLLVDCLLAAYVAQNSQLKSTTGTNCLCTVDLLMTGYKYARNMYRLTGEITEDK
jgi:hypothetical protein